MLLTKGTRNLKSFITARTLLKATVISAGLLLHFSANAAQFGVRVVDEAGLPVVGASVCFGLPGSYRQFGSDFTDADGQAIVDVPNIPFVVTVSKTRFSGVRLEEPGRGYNLVKQVTLVEGFPGPRCKAGSTMADNDLVTIKSVDVAEIGSTVTLTPVATGEPTDYRLSLTPDFITGNWIKLNGSIRVPSTLAKNRIVYMQLRRYEAQENSWLEARSTSARVYLPSSAPPPSL